MTYQTYKETRTNLPPRDNSQTLLNCLDLHEMVTNSGRKNPQNQVASTSVKQTFPYAKQLLVV